MITTIICCFLKGNCCGSWGNILLAYCDWTWWDQVRVSNPSNQVTWTLPPDIYANFMKRTESRIASWERSYTEVLRKFEIMIYGMKPELLYICSNWKVKVISCLRIIRYELARWKSWMQLSDDEVVYLLVLAWWLAGDRDIRRALEQDR